MIKVIFILSFLLRILLVPMAYHGDLNNNISWGKSGTYGFKDYYERQLWEYSSPNQPPIYILVYTLIYGLYKNLNSLLFYLNNNFSFFPSKIIWFWEEKGLLYLVKSPGIIADILIGLVIYRLLSKHNIKNKKLFTSLWLFNPVIIYNSSIWGQTDSLVNLFGILSLIFLLRKKITFSLSFFTIGILYKPSLAILFPLILLILIKQKHKYLEWVKSALIILLITIFSSFLFHPYLDLPFWLINLYTNKFFPGEIGFLTANAFNLWWIVNPSNFLDSNKFLFISYRIIGFILFFTVYLKIISLYKKVKNNYEYYLLFAIVVLGSFMLLTRIHERYMYPFFPLAVIYSAFNKKLLPYYIFFSISSLLNHYHLFWAPSIKILENIFLYPHLATILSLLNVAIFLHLLFRSKKIVKLNI